MRKSDKERVPDALLERYIRVVPINRSRGAWSRQRRYGAAFPVMKHRMSLGDLSDMLTHRYWIACRAPSNGMTDRLTFDIDAKTASDVAARNERYLAIRQIIGEARSPLVYGTPSGFGLRVVYRIPSVPLAELVTGIGQGLVAEVLGASGIDVTKGAVELFPQRLQAERLPLGKDMPFLDPQSLEPFAPPNIGSQFDLAALERGLLLLEKWHREILTDLIDHVAALPRRALSVRTDTERTERSANTQLERVASLSSDERLVVEGLTAPKTRQRAEARVLRAFLSDPDAYPDYGLAEGAERRAFASALAHWLATHHNGYSEDWRRTVEQVGSESEAEAVFAEKYMEPRKDGSTFIDRMASRRRAEGESSFTPEPDDRDMAGILTLSDLYVDGGATKYRFECWTTEYLRRIKRLILRSRRMGSEQATRIFGDERVIVELHSNWMRRWPYGGGRSKATGQIRYREYLGYLQEAEVVRLSTPYRAPNMRGGGKGQANRFAVRVPNLTVRVEDLPVTPERLNLAIGDLQGYGGVALTFAEALHALYVTSNVPNIFQRYGKLTARRIQGIDSAIRSL